MDAQFKVVAARIESADFEVVGPGFGDDNVGDGRVGCARHGIIVEGDLAARAENREHRVKTAVECKLPVQQLPAAQGFIVCDLEPPGAGRIAAVQRAER